MRKSRAGARTCSQPLRAVAPPRPSGCPCRACCLPSHNLDNAYFYTHTQHVRYSFDPVKRASNLEKHGLDLADAPQVIESGETVTFEDRRFAYGEERFVTLGPLDDVLVVIVTAEAGDQIRVISMRRADRHEQSIYRESRI